MTSRRDFLKTAAAAAAVPVAVSIPVPAAQAVVPAVVPKPYSNYVWEWFVSNDGEIYYESFETAEQAIEYAKQCDYSIVAEAKRQDFDISIDGWRILEQLNDDNYEQVGEGEGITCTKEQVNDLSRMLTQAFEAWVVKHGIDISAWSFGDIRNNQRVA